MEKIVYPEEIRALADQIAQKLVVRKAKRQYGVCNQELAKVIQMESDYYGMTLQKSILWKLRMLQKVDDSLNEREPGVRAKLAQELTQFFKGRIVRIADSLFARFDNVEFTAKPNPVVKFSGKAFDTFHKEADDNFVTYGAVVKATPSPLKLNLGDGQHYDLAFPRMNFVTWDEVESELNLVDPTNTFGKVVMDLLGINKDTRDGENVQESTEV